MSYAGKSVLITGGLGFIGSNLARNLVQQGAQVTIADSLIRKYGGNLFNVHDVRDQLTINICDVRDAPAMERLLEGKDYLFNLAAQTAHADSMAEPFVDLEINVTAQLSMLEACRRVAPAIRIVYTSTRQLYGIPEYLPVDEKHPVRPTDVNGINKFAGEGYHLLYGKVYGIRSTVLRLTNTYGPGMRTRDARQTFLGIWFRSLLEGRQIQVFGDGTQRRDLTYVDDCIDALLKAGACDMAVGRIYNLGGEEVISLRRLAEMLVEIGREMGIAGDYKLVPFPTERKVIDIGDYYGDYSFATRDLAWKPRTELRAGLRKSLEYYRLNQRQYWEDLE